jgi:hypothetical protein
MAYLSPEQIAKIDERLTEIEPKYREGSKRLGECLPGKDNFSSLE